MGKRRSLLGRVLRRVDGSLRASTVGVAWASVRECPLLRFGRGIIEATLPEDVPMFEKLRKRRNDREAAKQRAEFEQAAAESDPISGAPDDRRARDLPDLLGDFNEMTRMGPTIGVTGTTGG